MIDFVAIVGLHWILKYGSILNRPREIVTKIPIFNKLFKCSLCLGTWCGVIVGVYTKNDPILYGCCGAAGCWLFDNVNIVLQRVDIKLEK